MQVELSGRYQVQDLWSSKLFSVGTERSHVFSVVIGDGGDGRLDAQLLV